MLPLLRPAAAAALLDVRLSSCSLGLSPRLRHPLPRPLAAPVARAVHTSRALRFSDSSSASVNQNGKQDDYYTLLAPELSSASLGSKWAVDVGKLKAAWRRAQALTHPDRMVSASPAEQDAAAQRSALVNRAYETLRDPLARAVYLLETYTPAQVDAEERLTDPMLLAQVFELQEQLEDAEGREDYEDALQTAEPHLSEAEAAIAEQLGADSPDWEVVKSQIARLKYFGNIRREALAGLDAFDD